MTRALRVSGLLAALIIGAGIAWTSRSHANESAPHAARTVVVTITVTPEPTISTPTRQAQPSRSSAAPSYRGPEAVAAAYVTAAHSLDWHWTSAAGYLPKIKPLVTADYWAAKLEPLAAAPSGQSWLAFKSAHGLQTVTVAESSIAIGAPRTATGCVVRVTYSRTISGDPTVPQGEGSTAQGVENVVMLLVAGHWLVSNTSTDGG
jgi:hypothetical protein